MHRVAPAAGYLGLLSKLKLGLKIRNGNSSDMYFEFSDAVHFALKHIILSSHNTSSGAYIFIARLVSVNSELYAMTQIH